MTRLFATIFLWFWLPLVGVALVLAFGVMHAGFGYKYLLRLTLHDLLLFSLTGAVFCYLISRHLTRPLAKLGAAAANIADGRLETRVDPSLRLRRDEIADLARNFDRMAERIEALITGQRRLLGDVSHELRSPLSRLMVALSLAKQGHATEAAENLERIGLEARRLDTMIGQLLALTRIDSGVDRGSPAQFDLTNLIQEVASDGDFEARARSRRVVIQHADACTVDGFEELLRSAVENVVRNAIRHTAEGTEVEISLQAANSRALLRVRDHGPGVPESMLSEIFLPFRRVANGNSEGAGLGLAIAERAVIVHGGTISAKNAAKGGLIVEIDLPHSTGSDLVAGVLKPGPYLQRLHQVIGPEILLTMICPAIPVLLVVITLIGATQAVAQLPPKPAGRPSFDAFEVATIKPAGPDDVKAGRYIRMQSAHRFQARNYTLNGLIAAAYYLHPRAISGGPAWTQSDRYEIIAATPGELRPTYDDQMTMLRKLLVERFHLAFHRAKKEFSIYELTVSTAGVKFNATAAAPDEAPNFTSTLYPAASGGIDHALLPARNVTMAQFASLLQRAILDKPVIDHTDLKSRYDFDLEWTPDESQFGGQLPFGPPDSAKPGLFAAMQQQLGLKIEAARGPIETLVIDQIERPSEN